MISIALSDRSSASGGYSDRQLRFSSRWGAISRWHPIRPGGGSIVNTNQAIHGGSILSTRKQWREGRTLSSGKRTFHGMTKPVTGAKMSQKQGGVHELLRRASLESTMLDQNGSKQPGPGAPAAEAEAVAAGRSQACPGTPSRPPGSQAKVTTIGLSSRGRDRCQRGPIRINPFEHGDRELLPKHRRGGDGGRTASPLPARVRRRFHRGLGAPMAGDWRCCQRRRDPTLPGGDLKMPNSYTKPVSATDNTKAVAGNDGRHYLEWPMMAPANYEMGPPPAIIHLAQWGNRQGWIRW